MLSAWIRDRSFAGSEIAELNSDTLKNVEDALPSYKVSEKQMLLLRAIERKTSFPGQAVELVFDFDYPLAWTSGPEEFLYMLRSLGERGLIRSASGGLDIGVGNRSYKGPDGIYHEVSALQITAGGWAILDDRARSAIISDQAFVAMSFSADLQSAWTSGMRPALKAAGYRPYRVDSEPHIERIDSKIIAEIKNSRFVVADVTHQRPGVYFEAGYALGLGLPVFWSVRSDDLSNVHFDTRQYNHVVWNNEQHLADQLCSFVVAVVGKGSAI